MAENSHISWTDNTHNEWIGCTKVSAGCDNCYAEREQDLRFGRAKWGKGNARHLTSEANRRKPFQWEKQAIAEGRRIKVFTASLSDVFDEEVPDEWRDRLFDTIRATPHLDWLVLTKRLAKMLRYVADVQFGRTAHPELRMPSNVWYGCSVEDQPSANQRIRELLKLRALVGDSPLWLSVEPLLGPISLAEWLCTRAPHFSPECPGNNVDWVVVGGESGPAARPMHPDWARSLRDQCVAAGVAFHFKQWGEWVDLLASRVELEGSGSEYQRIWMTDEGITKPVGVGLQGDFDSLLYRVGKKAAGRLLDGREWNEFPKMNNSGEVECPVHGL